MSIDGEQDLQALLKIGRIVGMTIETMKNALQVGMTTAELDAIGAAYLKSQGARSAPQLMYNFPAATCISINDEVAHAIAGSRVIQPGDLVNIDVSAELDGYFADAGMSVPMPPVTPEVEHLCQSGRDALEAAIEAARGGSRLNAIGRAVETLAIQRGYRVIRDLGGHGVGRSLHEEPRRVPNYFTNRVKDKLVPGMVMTIEPFLTPGTGKIYTAADGWTLKTSDGQPGVQYEHTVVITEGRPILLTAV